MSNIETRIGRAIIITAVVISSRGVAFADEPSGQVAVLPDEDFHRIGQITPPPAIIGSQGGITEIDSRAFTPSNRSGDRFTPIALLEELRRRFIVARKVTSCPEVRPFINRFFQPKDRITAEVVAAAENLCDSQREGDLGEKGTFQIHPIHFDWLRATWNEEMRGLTRKEFDIKDHEVNTWAASKVLANRQDEGLFLDWSVCGFVVSCYPENL